ncbi:hypothetical protein [Streptomyces halobius]|uniref:Uncharacterized protein n=1 Tax=Streptomyces halobius TaxID=2879846 RepID=A0ABY4MAR5_9ACTN|nr:hypothetical protein [Streptomyces halobius]UQA94865.1 hypothetical protein K9S39_26105 [Streptomyces halobius]
MLPAVSILQLIGFAVLLVAIVTWVTGLVRLARWERAEASGQRRRQQLLSSVPRQTGPGGPPSESVELSAAEREAFAGLVRQLTSRR